MLESKWSSEGHIINIMPIIFLNVYYVETYQIVYLSMYNLLSVNYTSLTLIEKKEFSTVPDIDIFLVIPVIKLWFLQG